MSWSPPARNGSAPPSITAPKLALPSAGQPRLKVKPLPSDFGKTSFSFLEPVQSVYQGVENVVGQSPLGKPLEWALGEDSIPGQAMGSFFDLISTPERLSQGEWAKARLRQEQPGEIGALTKNISQGMAAALRGVPGMPVVNAVGSSLAEPVPEDILRRVQSGENIDALSQEMVERGVGYTNDPLANLAISMAADPLNVLSFVGVGLQAVKGAGAIAKAPKALKVAEGLSRGYDATVGLGLPRYVIGKGYNAAVSGLNATQQRLVSALWRPVIQGNVDALGERTFRKLYSAFPEVTEQLNDGLAHALPQLQNEIVAREMGLRMNGGLGGTLLAKTPAQLEGEIIKSKEAISSLGRKAKTAFEREVADLRNQVRLGMNPDDRLTWFVQRMAAFTGWEESAVVARIAKAYGKNWKPSSNDVEVLRDAIYGRVGNDLMTAATRVTPAQAKKARLGRPVEDLTLVAPETLDMDTALELASLDAATEGGKLIAATRQFPMLARALGRDFSADDVRAFLLDLVDRKALPQLIKKPTTGKNPLPPALREAVANAEKFGYRVGFAPDDLWKTATVKGKQRYIAPFVRFTAETEDPRFRNPLIRVIDGAFKANDERAVFHRALMRGTEYGYTRGMESGEAKSFFYRLLDEARARSRTPRGMSFDPQAYVDILRRAVGETRADELMGKGFDPVFAVMHAFMNDPSMVGLTSWFTGAMKRAVSGFGGGAAVAVPEAVYPLIRFRGNPIFQSQEFIESPVWNALRGIHPTKSLDDPEILAVKDLIERIGTESSDRWLFEAYASLYIAGSNTERKMLAQNTMLGKLLARAPDIQRSKKGQELRQIASMVGEEFQKTIEKIDPGMWPIFKEAYGTDDPGQIFRSFMQERRFLSGADAKPGNFFSTADPDTQVAFLGMLQKEGYLFHGSPVHPSKAEQVFDESGFFMAREPSHAEWYARGDKIDSAIYKEGDVYVAKPPTNPLHLNELNSTDMHRVIGELARYADEIDEAYLLDAPSETKVLRDAAAMRREINRARNAKTLGEQRAGILSAAMEYAKATNPDAFVDLSLIKKIVKDDLGADAYLTTEMNPKTGLPADVVAYADRPEVRSVSEIYAERNDPLVQFIKGMKPQNFGIDPSAARKGALEMTSQAADEETIWQAAMEAFRRSADQAYRTHFFNPARSPFERTINHPYLGLYPASYMWGKVIPEFSRFLLKRPFGLKAPLLGLAAIKRVNERITTQLAEDKDFNKAMADAAGLIYFTQLMLPATPGEIPVNLPAWFRHVSADVARGDDVTADTVAREIGDTWGYLLVRPFSTSAQAVGDVPELANWLQKGIWDEIDSAAKQDDLYRSPFTKPQKPRVNPFQKP